MELLERRQARGKVDLLRVMSGQARIIVDANAVDAIADAVRDDEVIQRPVRPTVVPARAPRRRGTDYPSGHLGLDERGAEGFGRRVEVASPKHRTLPKIRSSTHSREQIEVVILEAN